MTYTNKKDFERFQKECLKWADKLNLNEWDFKFQHKNIDAYADCTSEMKSKTIIMRLNKIFELEGKTKLQQIKSSARHEMLHTLLENLYHQAIARNFNHESYLAEEHSVIHRLERLL